MDISFAVQANKLYEQAYRLLDDFLQPAPGQVAAQLHIPAAFNAEFFRLIDKVNARLIDDTDNFYGYFLFQMAREIRFDLSSPTSINFKGDKYVLYFNPIIFLTLTPPQMASSIKHEILHILSLHLLRAKECQGRYGTLATNMAMDIVVNTYLDHLPPYATTLEQVNARFSLHLLPFESFEYYADKIQTALDLLDETADAPEDDNIPPTDKPLPLYDPEKTHDLWEDSSEIDEQTLQQFTEKFVTLAQKGTIPGYLDSLIAALKNSTGELPWNLYLQRLLGAVTSKHKKTVTRRNRRQPERLDLRGQLRSHKAKIAVALDISGSISDAEFGQAMQEVLSIVKSYAHEITLIECDSDVRRVYTVKTAKDLKPRPPERGGTRFSPVVEYANMQKINVLIYFTDGQGEDKLRTPPWGYPVLWILSGGSAALSLQDPYGAVKKLRLAAIPDNSFDLSQVEKGGYSMNNQEKIGI